MRDIDQIHMTYDTSFQLSFSIMSMDHHTSQVIQKIHLLHNDHISCTIYVQYMYIRTIYVYNIYVQYMYT